MEWCSSLTTQWLSLSAPKPIDPRTNFFYLDDHELGRTNTIDKGKFFKVILFLRKYSLISTCSALRENVSYDMIFARHKLRLINLKGDI
jgi:hypothetical protein